MSTPETSVGRAGGGGAVGDPQRALPVPTVKQGSFLKIRVSVVRFRPWPPKSPIDPIGWKPTAGRPETVATNSSYQNDFFCSPNSRRRHPALRDPRTRQNLAQPSLVRTGVAPASRSTPPSYPPNGYGRTEVRRFLVTFGRRRHLNTVPLAILFGRAAPTTGSASAAPSGHVEVPRRDWVDIMRAR